VDVWKKNRYPLLETRERGGGQNGVLDDRERGGLTFKNRRKQIKRRDKKRGKLLPSSVWRIGGGTSSTWVPPSLGSTTSG